MQLDGKRIDMSDPLASLQVRRITNWVRVPPAPLAQVRRNLLTCANAVFAAV